MSESDPGTLARLALILWVPLSLVLFFVTRPERAMTIVLLGALLFLPEAAQFKLPYLPPLTKQNIPYLCCLAGMLLRCPGRVLRRPREPWFAFLVLAMLLGSVGTALTNKDLLHYGVLKTIDIRGLSLKDGLYTGIDQLFHSALPLFLGLSMFRKPKDVRDLLAGFALAGLLYAPFAFIEMRMSPQFHNWVYGYQQHSFLQTMRWGGYRPMVFMSHGLALARFFLVAMLAALVASSEGRRILGMPGKLVAAVLFVTLVLCKSTGAIGYAVFGLVVLAVARARMRQAIALFLAATVTLYPALRAAGAFPVDRIVGAAAMVGADRQQSLLFRFQNEDTLLAKARERILFGWGEYNRSAIFDDLGRPFSVTDGHWIVLFGILGAVGFVAAFGMLLWPVFVARRRMRAIERKQDRMLVSGVAFILALIAVDLVPNALWADYPYVFAGALVGLTRALARAPRRSAEREFVSVTAEPVAEAG